jgi:hypothetical protein
MKQFICKSPYTLPEEVCIDLIRAFEMDERKYIDDTFEHLIINTHLWSSVKNVVNYTLSDSLSKYLNNLDNLVDTNNWLVNEKESLTGLSEFHIKKFKKGFKSDWDNNTRDSTARVGFIIFLNTPSDETSGSVNFYNFEKIKPVRGDVLLFPITWTNIFKHSKVDKDLYILTGYFKTQS